MPRHDRATIAKRRDIMIVHLPRPSRRNSTSAPLPCPFDLVSGPRFGPKPQRHWTQLSIFNTLRTPPPSQRTAHDRTLYRRRAHPDVLDRPVRLMQDRGIWKKPAGG